MNIPRPSQAELDSMSHAEKDALILLLFDVVEKLERRLAELEVKVEKNSQNSSKPPSTDGLKKGPAEPRKPGEKPNGGQIGHKGETRRMVEHPDEVRKIGPVGYCACGASLDGQAATLGERRQQFEIPEPKYMVTEYRQMRVLCRCGLEHRGVFPDGVTPNVSFGPRLKGYAVGLVQGHFIALERTSAILGDQYGLQPSGGTVQKWVLDAASRLTFSYEANRQALLATEVVHFDESGMRVNGKLNWLHVAVSGGPEAAVHYSVHARRGQEAMEAAGILPGFTGHAVHDNWKPYWGYTACTHSLCNAHHLRELRYCEELTEQFWPIHLRHILVEGKQAVATARAEGKDALEPAQVTDLLSRYDEQVASGFAAWPVRPPELGAKGRPKQHEATNLLIRLRDYKTQIWRFLTDWTVPFDNNLAERMVRPVKVKLKVIGGFRAVGGSQAFCVLRSIWETDKLRGTNPFNTLRLAFQGGVGK
jgi:transposase